MLTSRKKSGEKKYSAEIKLKIKYIIERNFERGIDYKFLRKA